MSTLTPEQASQLDLLGTLHFVLAAFVGMFALLPLIHVGMGIAMLTGVFPDPNMSQSEAGFLGGMFLVVGLVFIVLGLTLAGALFLAGRRLKARRGHTYCIVIAGLACLFMPLGTILGVFTLILLMKPEVAAAFAASGK